MDQPYLFLNHSNPVFSSRGCCELHFQEGLAVLLLLLLLLLSLVAASFWWLQVRPPMPTRFRRTHHNPRPCTAVAVPDI